MNVKKVGEFIKQKRKEKKLTQKELAEKLSITDRAISKWERGICCPDISILKELSSTAILKIVVGCVCMWMCSAVSDCVTSWTVACQAPLSMEFSRREYWSGVPFPSPKLTRATFKLRKSLEEN